jgi:hypothetical protein
MCVIVCVCVCVCVCVLVIQVYAQYAQQITYANATYFNKLQRQHGQGFCGACFEREDQANCIWSFICRGPPCLANRPTVRNSQSIWPHLSACSHCTTQALTCKSCACSHSKCTQTHTHTDTHAYNIAHLELHRSRTERFWLLNTRDRTGWNVGLESMSFSKGSEPNLQNITFLNKIWPTGTRKAVQQGILFLHLNPEGLTINKFAW